MKTPQIIGGILSAVGLGAIIYFGFVRKFGADKLTGFQKLTKKKPKEDKSAGTGVGTGVGTGTPKVESGFPLSKGSRGALVTRLANALKLQWGEDTGTPTYIFGKDTLKALQEIGYGDSVPNEQTLKDIEAKKEKKLISPTKPAEQKEPFKRGIAVYSNMDNLGIYTKPQAKGENWKISVNKFDKVGLYFGQSTESGWSKVYVALFEKTFFVVTNGLTDKKA